MVGYVKFIYNTVWLIKLTLRAQIVRNIVVRPFPSPLRLMMKFDHNYRPGIIAHSFGEFIFVPCITYIILIILYYAEQSHTFKKTTQFNEIHDCTIKNENF